MECDIAIIGGGPAGSTAGTLLKKYRPDLRVCIFERERFPRDHIGESQLPAISAVLEEMGCWDKIEAANFPIKIGSTNRWGKNPELWDFEFYPSEQFKDEHRPAKFEGQRRSTAFQVDRSIYDKILLDHAAECGVDVYQETAITKIVRTGDKVDHLLLSSGETVTAKHYVDASGHTGVLRRAMGVRSEYPTTLQNVAFWDYWQNAEWAVEIGVGGTKIQVMSLGYGWLWFIPLGPTRTSIGLVLPAEHYKKCGKRPETLYMEAIAADERISGLTANAHRENKFQTTKNWSFLSSRQCGENWFLIGESAGFADPILSAGMTMAHAGGRELAYVICEIERGEQDLAWLKDEFQKRQSQRVISHIRFADFWYTANAQFKDLREFTQQLAADVGLDLSPEKAWQWIAQGGFIDEDLNFGSGGFTLSGIKALGDVLTEMDSCPPFEKYNSFKLNLRGASWKSRAHFAGGRVTPSQAYIRGERVLPIDGPYAVLVELLQRTDDLSSIIELLQRALVRDCPDPAERDYAFFRAMQAFEALIQDGWVTPAHNPNRPMLEIRFREDSVRLNSETVG